MSTHNIGFYGQISEIIPKLSSNMRHICSAGLIFLSRVACHVVLTQNITTPFEVLMCNTIMPIELFTVKIQCSGLSLEFKHSLIDPPSTVHYSVKIWSENKCSLLCW